MRLISLKIHNILSIENATINFQPDGIVLVDGWNHDDNRANGAGKTAIFNALTFGIFNKVPRKITASEIVRRGTKKSFVEIELVSGEDTWHIRREKPNSITFKCNGEIKPISQAEFEASIKVSYQHLLLAMYTSQSASDKFIFLNDSDKKEELLKLLNMDALNDAKDKLVSEIKTLEKQLSGAVTGLASAESNIQMLSDFIVEDNALLDEIRVIEESMTPIKTQMDENLAIARPDFKKYDTIEQKIALKEEERQSTTLSIAEKRNEYKKIEAQMRHMKDLPTVECPSCNTGLHIIGTGVCTASDRLSMARQIQDNNANVSSQLDVIKSEIALLSSMEDTLRSAVQTASAKLKDIKTQESADYMRAQRSIIELQSQYNRLETKRDGVEIRAKQNRDYKAKINKLRTALKTLNEEIESFKGRLLIKNTLLAIVSPTGVPAYIMDSVVEQLNEQVTDNLSILWPNASYKLMSFRENKSGDVRAKFSEVISISGQDCSLGSLSGGELKSISLAVDIAFSDLVEKLLGVELNPLILDEPFDGMDAVSRERAMDLLTTISLRKQVFIIDHASELRSTFSTVLRVEKKSDISTVSFVI